MKYPYQVLIPSDPAKVGLGFLTREVAEAHRNCMNSLRKGFDQDPTWNKSYWKSKPEPWVVKAID